MGRKSEALDFSDVPVKNRGENAISCVHYEGEFDIDNAYLSNNRQP